jgi:hypothetical protein
MNSLKSSKKSNAVKKILVKMGYYLPQEPILFRFHRGSLEDSLSTLTEIKSMEDLRTLINLELNHNFGTLGVDIYMDHPDKRIGIGWERTFIVTADGKPVGFTNGMPSSCDKTSYLEIIP